MNTSDKNRIIDLKLYKCTTNILVSIILLVYSTINAYKWYITRMYLVKSLLGSHNKDCYRTLSSKFANPKIAILVLIAIYHITPKYIKIVFCACCHRNYRYIYRKHSKVFYNHLLIVDFKLGRSSSVWRTRSTWSAEKL